MLYVNYFCKNNPICYFILCNAQFFTDTNRVENKENNFADRIDSLLRIQNRTRKSLCDSVGISINAISTWKARQTLPAVDIAMKIAYQLNTTLDYLVYGDSDSSQTPPNSFEGAENAPVKVSEKNEYPGMNGAAMVGRIDSALQQRNLKRVDMCLQLGIATSIMSTWKARNSFPAADTAVRIADFLGVSFRWLVTGDNGCNFDSSENDLEFKKKYENLKSAIKKTISEY